MAGAHVRSFSARRAGRIASDRPRREYVGCELAFLFLFSCLLFSSHTQLWTVFTSWYWVLKRCVIAFTTTSYGRPLYLRCRSAENELLWHIALSASKRSAKWGYSAIVWLRLGFVWGVLQPAVRSPCPRQSPNLRPLRMQERGAQCQCFPSLKKMLASARKGGSAACFLFARWFSASEPCCACVFVGVFAPVHTRLGAWLCVFATAFIPSLLRGWRN